nr:MAG TPA: attaching and effacing protein [Caudoviricetes sp.]
MIVGTKYDKELKEKVFYVREVDSYTHKTTTTLTVDWVDGVFTLTAVVGNLIGKGFVKFYRDGVEVGEQYVSKTATLLLQSETNTGVFVAKFMGNSDCLKSQSSEVSYTPLPHPEFSLSVDNDTGVVGDTLIFTPQLSDGATGSIVYAVDGTEYMKNVGETFSYKFNKSGSFIVSAVYSGDESYQGATASVLVTISKINIVFTGSASSTNVYVGETVTISGTLETSTGSPLSNVSIVDGVGQVKATTDSSGAWSFTSVGDTVGTSGWSLYPDLDWDKYNTPENVNIQITTNKRTTVLTCIADKTSVTVGETVTLIATVESDGVDVNEGQVDFGDGVLVDVSNGTAVKTVTKTTPQSITFTPSYNGTSTYTAATASSLTITWIEEPTPEIAIAAQTLIGEVGDDLPITLSSNLKNTALTVLVNDAEIEDSVTTDSTGKASFNYNCTGAGDANVKVKYLDGTDVYYSNILSVEDCIKYGFKDSDTWINPTGHSATNIVEDGVFTSASSSSKGDSILQLDVTGDFIITYDAHWYAASRCGVGAKDTTRSYHFDSATNTAGSNQKYVYYNGSTEVDAIYKYENPMEYVNCKIIKQNDTLTGYMNDTEVVSVGYDWISQCTVWNFHTTMWNTSNIHITNLKIKSI